MLKKSDIKEIAKTLKIKDCSIPTMVGAYVDKDKEIVCRINQNFLTMPQELVFKYLALIEKLYSKHVVVQQIKRCFNHHIILGCFQVLA